MYLNRTQHQNRWQPSPCSILWSLVARTSFSSLLFRLLQWAAVSNKYKQSPASLLLFTLLELKRKQKKKLLHCNSFYHLLYRLSTLVMTHNLKQWNTDVTPQGMGKLYSLQCAGVLTILLVSLYRRSLYRGFPVFGLRELAAEQTLCRILVGGK